MERQVGRVAPSRKFSGPLIPWSDEQVDAVADEIIRAAEDDDGVSRRLLGGQRIETGVRVCRTITARFMEPCVEDGECEFVLSVPMSVPDMLGELMVKYLYSEHCGLEEEAILLARTLLESPYNGLFLGTLVGLTLFDGEDND